MFYIRVAFFQLTLHYFWPRLHLDFEVVIKQIFASRRRQKLPRKVQLWILQSIQSISSRFEHQKQQKEQALPAALTPTRRWRVAQALVGVAGTVKPHRGPAHGISLDPTESDVIGRRFTASLEREKKLRPAPLWLVATTSVRFVVYASLHNKLSYRTALKVCLPCVQLITKVSDLHEGEKAWIAGTCGSPQCWIFYGFAVKSMWLVGMGPFHWFCTPPSVCVNFITLRPWRIPTLPNPNQHGANRNIVCVGVTVPFANVSRPMILRMVGKWLSKGPLCFE